MKELQQRKQELAEKLGKRDTQILEAYSNKDVLGLNDKEVAEMCNIGRTTLHKIKGTETAKEYLHIVQLIKENTAGADGELNIYQAFKAIKDLVIANALKGNAKAIETSLKYRDTFVSIEEDLYKSSTNIDIETILAELENL